MGNVQPGGPNYNINYDRANQTITYGIGTAVRIHKIRFRDDQNATTQFSDQKAQSIMQGMHQMFALYSKNLEEVARKPPDEVQRILNGINFTYSGIMSGEIIAWEASGKVGPKPFEWKTDEKDENATEIAGMLIKAHQELLEPSIIRNIPQVEAITARPHPQPYAADPAKRKDKLDKIAKAQATFSWFKSNFVALRKFINSIPKIGSKIGSLLGPWGLDKLKIKEPMEFSFKKCEAKVQITNPDRNGYVIVSPYILGDQDDLVEGNGCYAIKCPRVMAAIGRTIESKEHKAEYMKSCTVAFDSDGNKLLQPEKAVNILTVPIDDKLCETGQDTVKTFIQMYSGYEHIARTQQGVALTLDADQVRQSLPIYLMHKLSCRVTGCSEKNNLDDIDPYKAAREELNGLINVGLTLIQVVSLIPKIVAPHCPPQAAQAQPAPNPLPPQPNP